MNNISKCVMSLLLTLPCVGNADGFWYGSPRTLYQNQWWGDYQPTVVALDSPIVLGRTNKVSGTGTQEILSLIMDQPVSSQAWPWAQYIQVTSRQLSGDAVGLYTRMYAYGNWATALHAEPLCFSGTCIGLNVESSPMSSTSNIRSVGINVQGKNGYNGTSVNRWGDEAINIQADSSVGWKYGIRFDNVNTQVGIAMENNRICFDKQNQVCLFYNAGTGKLLLKRGTTLLQKW